MTASTFYNEWYYPYYGRLNDVRKHGSWCAKTTSDRTDYLQVDMGAVHSVCAVATQGGKNSDERTTSYKLLLSTDGITWNAHKENNVEKVSYEGTRFLFLKRNKSNVIFVSNKLYHTRYISEDSYIRAQNKKISISLPS